MEERLRNCYSIEDLKAEFSFTEIFKLAREGLLQEWLSENFLDFELDRLNSDRIKPLIDDELMLEICETLQIDVENLSEDEARWIEYALENRDKRATYLADKNFVLVSKQSELIQALRAGHKKICLCKNQFSIPILQTGITYVGRDNAIIDVTSRDPISFDRAEIHLEDLTLFLHYLTEEDIEAKGSKNLNILVGKKLALDEYLTLQDLLKQLEPRNSFETLALFQRRISSLKGIVVGTVLLEEKDYDVFTQCFTFHPKWKVEFTKFARRFSVGRNFCFYIDPEQAQTLFEFERKLLLYADFEVENGEAVILRVYFVSKFLKTEIQIGDLKTSIRRSSSSGSDGRLAYGLNLINPNESRDGF